MSGKAYIIGCGPGDEELLTIKAVKVLEKCTVVLYDRLVSNNILNYTLHCKPMLAQSWTYYNIIVIYGGIQIIPSLIIKLRG